MWNSSDGSHFKREIYRTEDNGKGEVGDPSKEFSWTYFCYPLLTNGHVSVFCRHLLVLNSSVLVLDLMFSTDTLNKIFPLLHKAIHINHHDVPGKVPTNSSPNYKFHLFLHPPLVAILWFGSSLRNMSWMLSSKVLSNENLRHSHHFQRLWAISHKGWNP